MTYPAIELKSRLLDAFCVMPLLAHDLMKTLCLILFLSLAGAVAYYEVRLAPETAILQANLEQRTQELQRAQEKARQDTQSLAVLTDTAQAAKDALKAKESDFQALQAKLADADRVVEERTAEVGTLRAALAALKEGSTGTGTPAPTPTLPPTAAPRITILADGTPIVESPPSPPKNSLVSPSTNASLDQQITQARAKLAAMQAAHDEWIAKHNHGYGNASMIQAKAKNIPDDISSAAIADQQKVIENLEEGRQP